MKVIKIGIVEDELIIADTIIATLQNLGYETTEPCMTYTRALEMIEEDKPDLVLLDIQLAGKKTGIDVAEVLNRDYDIPFIFLTSNADVATIEEAKLVNPYAYLVKPFNKDDLFTAIEIAMSNYGNKIERKAAAINNEKLKNVLFIKNKDRFHSIKHDDILFLKSDHVYVEISTEKETHLVRSTLENFVQKLPLSFFQVHRRFIINLNYLTEIKADHVMVKEHEIPLSKSNRIALMKIIDLF